MAASQLLNDVMQDLRCAARALLRNTRFTLAAVFAIALGVGASTAVFSAVDRILFRSLPYHDSDRLVSFGIVAPIVPQEFMLAYDYLDWRGRQAPFASLGALSDVSPCDLADGNPIRLRWARVDAALLPTLGIHPMLGRNFTQQEDRPNGPKVAMISNGLWRSRFGEDPRILGKQVRLDTQSGSAISSHRPSPVQQEP
jgi:hypothetical protein